MYKYIDDGKLVKRRQLIDILMKTLTRDISLCKSTVYTLQELKLQGMKICDGVVLSRYSRA